MLKVRKKNQNKKRLVTLSIGLLLVFAPVTQALVLKIATVSPDGTIWMTKMREGAAEIKQKTAGRVRFKFYPGGVMGNAQSVLRKMRFGQLQGGAFTSGSLNEVYPDIQIYAMPFLFDSLQQVDFVRQRMDALLMQGLEKKGYISFGLVGAGFAYTMSTVPIQSMDDFRKNKVWIPAGDKISLLAMKTAGITPIPLPLADVLTGLQTGMVDIAAVTAVGAIAFQWYTKLPYFSDQPISYIYGLLAIDKKAFKKITAEDQAIVHEVLSRINREIDQHNGEDNEKAKAALIKQGIKFTAFPPDLLTQWQTYAKQAIAELGQQKAYSPTLFNTLQENLQLFEKSE